MISSAKAVGLAAALGLALFAGRRSANAAGV